MHAQRWLVLGWLSIGLGCSASVAPLDLPRPVAPDAGMDARDAGHGADRRIGSADAARPDAGRLDSGQPDVGRPDSGPPPVSRCDTPLVLGPPSGAREGAQAVTLGVLAGPLGEPVLEAIWSDGSGLTTTTFHDGERRSEGSALVPDVYRLGRTVERGGELIMIAQRRGESGIFDPGVAGALVSARTSMAGLSVDGALLRWVRRDENDREVWIETNDPQTPPVGLTSVLSDNELRDAWTRGDDAVAITWTDRVVSRRGGRSQTIRLAMEPWRLVELGDTGVVVVLGTVTSPAGARSGAAQLLGPEGRLVLLEGAETLGEEQVDAVGFVHDGRARIALVWSDNRAGPLRFAVLDAHRLTTEDRVRLDVREVTGTVVPVAMRPSIVWDPRTEALAVAWIDAQAGFLEARVWCGLEP